MGEMKTKMDLKKVFGEVSSILYQKDPIVVGGTESAHTATIAPTHEMPTTVETFKMSQADASIEHYKVIGLDSDWFSTSKSGDIDIELVVPTNHTEILKLCWGEDAVKSSVTIQHGSASFKGDALTLKKKKIEGAFILINSSNDKMLILNNIALWATPMFDDPVNKPFAVKLKGTMEAGAGDNIMFLEKAG